jgi:F-type H+-transporting ATPase subunit epsilon
MSRFTLHVQAATQYERIDDVVSFVGTDGSGSFGLLAGHERMITTLRFGLAQFRSADGGRQYLALPGAVLYFVNNELFINTRQYLRDSDYRRIADALEAQLVNEEANLQTMKNSLRRLEEEMFKRLWKMARRGKR